MPEKRHIIHEYDGKKIKLDPNLKDFCDRKESAEDLKKKYDSQLAEKIIERVNSNKHKGKFAYIVKC